MILLQQAVEECRAAMDGDNVKHFRENIIFFDARPENPTITRRRRDISSSLALIIIFAEHASTPLVFFFVLTN